MIKPDPNDLASNSCISPPWSPKNFLKKSYNKNEESSEKISAIFSAVFQKHNIISEKKSSGENNNASNKWLDLLNE